MTTTTMQRQVQMRRPRLLLPLLSPLLLPLLLLLLVLLVLASLCALPASATTYAINWTVVSATSASHTAISFDPTARVNLGPCLCDLTWLACDLNCYCDTSDCSTTQLARFTTALPNTTGEPTVSYCESDQLAKINAHGDITVSFLDNVMCVVKTNNAVKGTFLDASVAPSTTLAAALTSPALSSSQFQDQVDRTGPHALQGVDAYQSTSTSSSSSSSSSTSTSSSYLAGDAIQAVHAGTGSGSGVRSTAAYTDHDGVLVLPAPDTSGLCRDGNAATFLDDQSFTCTRAVDSLTTACGAGAAGPLAGLRFVDNLYVATLRTADINAFPASYVSVVLGTVQVLDPTTQTLSAVSVTSSAAFPAPTLNTATCTCSNVLLQAAYTLTVNASSFASLVSAKVDAIIGSVTAVGASCGQARVDQTFSVTYTTPSSTPALASAAATDASSASVERPKSGNPGYLVGAPLLSGTLVSSVTTTTAADGTSTSTTVQAIAQTVGGMSLLPTAANGQCSSSSSATATATSTPVTFGEDLYVACTLPLTAAQLETTCSAGVLSYLNISDTYLGMFGNADLANVNDWTPITALSLPSSTASTGAGVWVAPTLTCRSIVNSVTLQIAYAQYGLAANPQAGIVAARLVYNNTMWSFALTDATATQAFTVSLAVTYVKLDAADRINYVPSAPPLLPKFPSDLLYPLYIPSSASPAVASVSITSALLLALVSCALFALSFQY